MNQTETYQKLLKDAIELAAELKIEHTNWQTYLDSTQAQINEQTAPTFINGPLFDFVQNEMKHEFYWGDKCIPISFLTYSCMKAKGFDVELIIGNLNILNHPDDEFSCTTESLIQEYQYPNKENSFPGHAWVALGNDIIIDFAIRDRLVKRCRYPDDTKYNIAGPIDYIASNFNLQYKPMLTGLGFLSATSDIDFAADFKEIQRKLS